MCGIVAYIGKGNALTAVLSGLEKLEYRGYDSAGVAFLNGKTLQVFRSPGKLQNLRECLVSVIEKVFPLIAIGHTRWATHGKPSEENAHPHTAGRISLIHNGIVENYKSLKEKLLQQGRKFTSETDSEVIAQLIDQYLSDGQDFFQAVAKTCAEIRGSYALVIMDSKDSSRIILARNQSPMVIGLGKDFNIVASDIPALLEFSREVMFLEDGDIAEVSASSVKVFNAGKAVSRKSQTITWDALTAQKGGYAHYMLKEIFEQPEVVTETYRDKINLDSLSVALPELDYQALNVKKIKRVKIVACGSAYYAGLLGRYYFEALSGVACGVEYASEFRHRQSHINDDNLLIAVSQSGETADTLAALDIVKGKAPTLAICNVLGSTLTRKADYVLYTHAGPEISVASTKAFSAQLVTLYLLAIDLGVQRGVLSKEIAAQYIANLSKLPALLHQVLNLSDKFHEIAKKIYRATNCLFIGRSFNYPIALEGALKLKEISYIHAEAFPAGELKHGPLALVDKNLPVVVILPHDPVLFEKTFSNLLEVKAREGMVIAITDADVSHSKDLNDVADFVLQLPFISEALSPLVSVIPLQLLAYYCAVLNGRDVDQPRNLAKSVTVE